MLRWRWDQLLVQRKLKVGYWITISFASLRFSSSSWYPSTLLETVKFSYEHECNKPDVLFSSQNKSYSGSYARYWRQHMHSLFCPEKWIGLFEHTKGSCSVSTWATILHGYANLLCEVKHKPSVLPAFSKRDISHPQAFQMTNAPWLRPVESVSRWSLFWTKIISQQRSLQIVYTIIVDRPNETTDSSELHVAKRFPPFVVITNRQTPNTLTKMPSVPQKNDNWGFETIVILA